MRYILLASIFLFCFACASTSGVSYSPIRAQAPHPSLEVAFTRAQTLQSDFLVKADALRDEGRLIDGFALTAGLATLGFGAFDAHPDNVTAAALVTGITGGVRPVLGTQANLDILEGGARALSCVQTRASTLRLYPGEVGSSSAMDIAQFETFVSSTGNLNTLDALLSMFIGIAQRTPAQSEGLAAAIEAGQTARTKLAIGIKARREAPMRVGDAIDKIDTAVKLKRADFASILEAISKVEIPESKPSTPATDQSAVMGLLGFRTLDDGAIQFDEEQLIAVLNLLSNQVDQIAPEYEEEILKRVASCSIEYMAQ